MNKLIAVEVIILIIIAFSALSLLATGAWEAQATSQVSSFNTTFWDLEQSYPDLNMQISFASNTTSGNTTINQYDLWFDSHYYGDEAIRIHSILLVPNSTLTEWGCTLVNCTCVNDSCLCFTQCNTSLAPHDLPAVLLLHGTNGSADDMLVYGRILAAEGYAVLAMDSPGCGTSTGPACSGANIMNFTDGPYSSYYYHNVIAASRALTVLSGLPFANASALGVSGASMGGLTSFLLSAADGRVKVSAPVVAAGFLDESLARGSMINFILPKNLSSNDPLIREFVSYFDPRGYVPNLTVPTLMLIGTHDEFFFLDSVNKTYSILAEPGTLDLAPNQGHSFYAGWVGSASVWFNHYLKGSSLALPAVPNATVGPAFLYSALSISLTPTSQGNYTQVVFYRDTLPGSLWTEIVPGAGQTIPLLPLTSNIKYYVGVKDGNTLLATSPVYAVPATSAFFWIIVIFLVLLLVILASNWREEIWAYIASDMRGTLLFVIGVIVWLVAAYSLTIPWLSIPGKASLSLVQFWDAYALHLITVWALLVGMGIALFAFLARMWIGGIALAVMIVFIYSQIFWAAAMGVDFAVGMYLFGACVAVALVIPALVKILRD